MGGEGCSPQQEKETSHSVSMFTHTVSIGWRMGCRTMGHIEKALIAPLHMCLPLKVFSFGILP